MTLQTWSDLLNSSFQDLWRGVINFVPNLLVSLLIFVVGWLIAAVLGRWVAQVVRALNIDRFLKSVSLDELLGRGGFHLNAGSFLGGLVKWFIIVIFLVAAIDVLGLHQINIFLQEVVLGYLPNVIAAAVILMLSGVIAGVLQKVVYGAARAADSLHAELLGSVARWAVWIFGILAGLNQLGIAGPFIQTLFTGIIAMLALAGGLAFGLGGKESASRYLDKLRSDIGGR